MFFGLPIPMQEHFKKEEKEERVKREESHHTKRDGRRRGSMKKHEKHDEKQGDSTPVSNSAAEMQPSKFDNVEDVPTNFAETWLSLILDIVGFSCAFTWLWDVLGLWAGGHYDCAAFFHCEFQLSCFFPLLDCQHLDPCK